MTKTKKVARAAGLGFTKRELARMTPAERKRVRLVVRPRDSVLSLRFNEHDIAAWRDAAREEEPKRSLTDCIEELMNEWLEKRAARRAR
jgi:hypothetical protein